MKAIITFTMQEAVSHMARPYNEKLVENRLRNLCKENCVKPYLDTYGRGQGREFTERNLDELDIALSMVELNLPYRLIKRLMVEYRQTGSATIQNKNVTILVG